jgi:carboxyl-terminal processing protease
MNPYNKNTARLLVGILVIGAVFFIGMKYGESQNNFAFEPQGLANIDSGKPGNVDFSAFWKAWNILSDKFVAASSTTATTTDEQKMYGAISGLAASFNDPYTVFFPPVQNEIFQSDVRGNFDGVGMEVAVQNGVLTVVAPLKGTPADRGGVKSGDKIIDINGKTTANMTADESIALIRGAAGTSVDLTLVRAGVKDPIDVSLVRETIDIPTIKSQLLPNGIFEIDLYSFSATSPDLFRQALRQFVESGSSKLLIDLRGNPGGYLEAAIDIASWFLPPGKVVVSEDFGGKQDPIVYRSRGYDIFNKNLKMVILVDGGSASASEILAGALQEQGVATLVGEKTFGKGSVQELVDITPDTSLKVTIARWLTPDGHSIAEQGITPNVVVPYTKEDAAAGVDPQKDKAISILLGQ